MLFPLISLLGSIVVVILFALPFFGVVLVTGEPDSAQSVLGIILLFLFYLVTYTVVIFSNAALISAVMMSLEGQKPTVGDGFRAAAQHFRAVVGYAAISATVGVILNIINSAARDRDNSIVLRIIASILSGIVSIAWNLVTFFVVPVLVVEGIGPVAAIKRSWALFKKTWGEQVVGDASIGLIFGLITILVIIAGIPIVIVVASTGSPVLIVLVVLALVIGVIFISLLGSTMNGIFRASLYYYATEGSVGPYYDDTVVQQAFKPKNA
jgi:membrane-anchored glycerophosphoryl diester phosphodiesterase (GDPDase)